MILAFSWNSLFRSILIRFALMIQSVTTGVLDSDFVICFGESPLAPGLGEALLSGGTDGPALFIWSVLSTDDVLPDVIISLPSSSSPAIYSAYL